MIREGFPRTDVERELLAQFIEGRLRRPGRPRKILWFLPPHQWFTPSEEAAFRVRDRLAEMRERGESVYGARKRLIAEEAARTGLPAQAIENVIRRSKRARKTPIP
jgi:hypothetical protein